QYIETKYNSYTGKLENKSINLKDYAKHWIDLHSINIEIRTKNDYDYIIDSYIIPNLGYKKIADIKQNDIKELMKKMENTPTTAKKTLQLVKKLLNEAVNDDIVIKNVTNNIKSPKIVKNERLPISIDIDNRLLSSKSKYAPFFIFMRYTGMRREEIVPITVNDIDLVNKTICINKAVTFLHNQPVLKKTKNSKTRYVPILDIIHDLVIELCNEAKKENRELLFVKESDHLMLTESAIKRHLESFLYDLNLIYEKEQKEIGNKFEINKDNKIKFTCHQLRHSYCTMIYYSDVKIKEAQNLMGHSSAKMVYDIYTHLDTVNNKNTFDKMNRYIENSINSNKSLKYKKDLLEQNLIESAKLIEELKSEGIELQINNTETDIIKIISNINDAVKNITIS
ncbi:MAG: site-specific integrase, partial [Clostridia bacterium]|nr:site-specific integrase [Clostridia bacterium]